MAQKNFEVDGGLLVKEGANIGGNLEVTGEASVNGNTLATKVYVDNQVSAVVAGSAGSLDSLTDVDTTGVVSGNVLAYNGTNWVPSASTGGTSYTDADVASFLNGNLNGHIIPNTNSVYDLGSPEKKFRHLYLSDSTIYMGLADNTIRTQGTSLLFNGADLQDYTLLKNKPEIPTDVNQLTDASGLLSGGGGTVDAATVNVAGVVRGYQDDATGAVYYGGLSGQNIPTTGVNFNTLIGFRNGPNLSEGSNTLVGAIIGRNATSAEQNSALGFTSLYQLTTGDRNSAFGASAGYNLTTGTDNTFFGRQSGYNVVTGTYNTFVGNNTGSGNGHRNTVVGGQSFTNAIDTQQNVIIGMGSAQALESGQDNLIVGYNAGNTLVNGTRNIVIGYGAEPSSTTVSGEITIGDATNINRVRIPAIGFDTANAIDGYILAWNSSAGTLDWIPAPAGSGQEAVSTLSDLTDVDTTDVVTNSLLRYNGAGWVDTPPGHNSQVDADMLDGYHAHQFIGPLSGTIERALIVSTDQSNNQLQLNTTDTNSAARLYHDASNLYVQVGANGAGTTASSGGIRLSGYSNADVAYAQIRKNGLWNNIVTDGDINPSTVISTGDTATITLDPDPSTLGHIPVLINDLGFTRLRGGSLTSSNFTMSDAYFDAMFDPKGTFMYVDASSATDEASAMTFEFALAEGLKYDTKVGVSFSGGFGVAGIKVEAYRTSDSTWVEVINTSSNTDNYVTGSYNSLGGSGVTSFRVKLWSPTHVSGGVRMLHFNAIDFDSPLATTMFVDRTGGTVYGTITQTSDERLKTNITDIQNPLSKLSRLRGVDYTMTATGKDGVGFIAQEVEQVMPQLVETDEKTGLKSVAYSNMTGLLTEAVKELKGIVEAQAATIAAMQQQIDDLTNGN